VHLPDQEEIGDCRTKQPKDEVGSPIPVKHDGEQENDIIPELSRTNEIADQEQGQKIEQEYVAAEYHNSSSISDRKNTKSKDSTKQSVSIIPTP
jgi:hypothetical protein